MRFKFGITVIFVEICGKENEQILGTKEYGLDVRDTHYQLLDFHGKTYKKKLSLWTRI